jgi:dienelactone hydrolase
MLGIAAMMTMISLFSQTQGEAQSDIRLHEVRHGNMPFAFPVYRSLEGWRRRAEELRRHILVSCGLYPHLEKTPLKVRIFGRIEREDYTIEKVYFESFPGFYVTGNLYRPRGKKGPFPGVASPHGHWKEGRFGHDESGSVPGRCITLARQGYVVFSYDMIGYNDSFQLPHREFGGKREHLWGISMMGLQLLNSIRVVDFLQSLDDVDPDRIACTGASGGGTQTFMLMAVDDRVKVAAPVCMVSSHFQGGCVCENAPNLRVDTFNVEIAALMAPRPLILVSATGDWTVNTPFVEYPAIRGIYKLYDAEDRVRSVQIDAGHNYNRQSREAVYAWFGRWLLGETDEGKLRERPFQVEQKEDLLVFHDHPKPENALDAEGIVRYLITKAREKLDQLKPRNEEELERFKEIMRPGLRHALCVVRPEPEEINAKLLETVKGDGYATQRLILSRKGEAIPATLFIPLERKGEGTLLISPQGCSAFVSEEGKPTPMVRGFLEGGYLVLSIDPFMTGEYLSQPIKRDESVKFFTTFNRTDTAERVQDILTALAYLRGQESVGRVNMIGFGEAGLWGLLAAGVDGDLSHVAVDVDRFNLDDDEEWVERLFVPCIRREGDLRTAGALLAPIPLFIHNTGDRFDVSWISDVYRAVKAEAELRVLQDKASWEEAMSWICGQ